MWWHDIKDIKEWMITIADRLTGMQMKFLEKEDQECAKDPLEAIEQGLEELKESIEDLYGSDNSSINRIHEKLNNIVGDETRIAQASIAHLTLDKFDVYMENVEKLNFMVNEFKGCVSIARAAIADKKEMDDMRKVLKNMIETCEKYYNHQKTVSNQHFKIDAMYKKLCEEVKEKKKSPGRPKKKVTSPLVE